MTGTDGVEYALMTPEEYEAIVDTIRDRPWEDPGRYPECLMIALGVLGGIAIAPRDATVFWARNEATQGLRRMVQRTVLGGPLDEPEPPL